MQLRYNSLDDIDVIAEWTEITNVLLRVYASHR